ncbi:tartrate-resistant acid phosphatase type 5-like [Tubulanus polymorphus]|uniref:tartrate-resistant acid phosphatase type 5-like n=1 Tax=Tubulanus polymorphus TaxID=672921 RepID=UPI003DA43D82
MMMFSVLLLLMSLFGIQSAVIKRGDAESRNLNKTQYFHSGSSLSNSVRFMTVADWGGLPYTPFTTQIELAMATQMGKLAQSIQSEFTLALGDNFYYDGVQDIHDKRFQETFEQVFTAPALYKPWYFVAGNHDHYGNASAQIAYTKLSDRWHFPDYNYTLMYRVPGTNVVAEFIMIDTIIICGLGEPQPTGPKDELKSKSVLNWLEDKLKNSRADYLFVAGHYPIYSVAEHGPTACLLPKIEPLLHKYNVTAYLSGHDHNLQHLQYTDKIYKTLVNYFIIGAGAFIDPSLKHKHSVPPGTLKFHWADVTSFGGFASGLITANQTTFTFHCSNGKILYRASLLPRRSGK